MCDFSEYGGPSEEWLIVEKSLPSLTFDLSQDPVKLQKAVNDGREQAAAKEMELFAPHLHILNHIIPTRDGASIEARSYHPNSKTSSEKLPVYLFFHGGGYTFGTIKTDDPACARIAINLGIVVLNVNYRHTPQYTYPTAWNDAQDAYSWLHNNMSTFDGDASQVVIGGISAGAQLSASLVLEKQLGKALTKFPPIAGQILIIPPLVHADSYAEGPGKKLKSPEVSSLVQNEHAPLLPAKTIKFFMELLQAGAPDSLYDTKLNVGNATPDMVQGMPPTVFGVAGLDPLRDEALLYAKTLSEASVPTKTTLFKGVPHGFRRFGNQLKACEKWDEVVEQGILWALSKPKASGKFEVQVV